MSLNLCNDAALHFLVQLLGFGCFLARNSIAKETMCQLFTACMAVSISDFRVSTSDIFGRSLMSFNGHIRHIADSVVLTTNSIHTQLFFVEK